MNKFHWLNSSLLLIKGLGVNARNIGCDVKPNKNHTRYLLFEVPSSMVELLIEVLNKILLFRQKVRYYDIKKNNCVTELMRLPVSACNG